MLAALKVANAERFEPPLPEAGGPERRREHRLLRARGPVREPHRHRQREPPDPPLRRAHPLLRPPEGLVHLRGYALAPRRGAPDRGPRQGGPPHDLRGGGALPGRATCARPCVKWATRSESRATRKATVENARSDPRVCHPPRAVRRRWLAAQLPQRHARPAHRGAARSRPQGPDHPAHRRRATIRRLAASSGSASSPRRPGATTSCAATSTRRRATPARVTRATRSTSSSTVRPTPARAP